MTATTPIYKQVFNALNWTIWGLYILVYLGVSIGAPEYLNVLREYAQLYIGLILLYRFNPIRQYTFTETDANIACSAGVILVLSSKKVANWVNDLRDVGIVKPIN
jgi:hypothetical protein